MAQNLLKVFTSINSIENKELNEETLPINYNYLLDAYSSKKNIENILDNNNHISSNNKNKFSTIAVLVEKRKNKGTYIKRNFISCCSRKQQSTQKLNAAFN